MRPRHFLYREESLSSPPLPLLPAAAAAAGAKRNFPASESHHDSSHCSTYPAPAGTQNPIRADNSLPGKQKKKKKKKKKKPASAKFIDSAR